jgi:RND family efflux transporter MFP subunit
VCRLPWLVVLGAAVGAVGCGKDAPTTPALPTPVVSVATPVRREVAQYEFFTGRTEGIEKVDVRARVSGELKKIYFTPGTEVEKDAPLFEIDPEPFKADLAKSKAELLKAEADLLVSQAAVGGAEARVITATADFNRAEKTYNLGAGSKEDVDKNRGLMLEAEAYVKSGKAKIEADKGVIAADKAKVRLNELNLGYCSIRAPIAGRIGDKLVAEGNLISGGLGPSTLLTTIISTDPMHAMFDVDENTLQRIQKAEREGRIEDPTPGGAIPAEAGLAIHGTDYPLRGNITFLNNQVDPKTGTIRVKAEFPNPKDANGRRLLSAGMFTRVRVPIGKAKMATLVPESAILSDQGVKYILTVDGENKVTRLDLEPGVLDGGFRVVEAVHAPGGEPRPLRPDERVIVSGLQRVRPDMTVDPKPAAPH